MQSTTVVNKFPPNPVAAAQIRFNESKRRFHLRMCKERFRYEQNRKGRIVAGIGRM